MVDELMADYGSRFLIAAVAVAVGLLCLAAVLWFMKNRSSSPFIRGGKNRQPRLAVLDAAAVDARRRLVLVRRDDVEHLIMIGGPTDIVIESRIGKTAQPGVQDTVIQPAVVTPEIRQPDIRQAEAKQPEVKQLEARQADVRQPEVRRQDVRQHVITPDPRPQQNAVQPTTRTEQRQEPKVSPVSGMGQVLYSEEDEERLRQQRVAADARMASERGSLQAQRREPLVQQPAATTQQAMSTPLERVAPTRSAEVVPQNQQVSQQIPIVSSGVPATTPVLSTEDILDAARLRVLPPQREAALPTSVIKENRPESRPAVQAEASSDFERILDAEISGDLQRLAPVTQRDAVRPNIPTQPRQGERQEPQLTSPITGARNEPTIEQEMARMLGELSVSRKN